jgi:hypothetical protein
VAASPWHWRTDCARWATLPIDQCRGYELGRAGGHSAIDSLRRALPPELRQNPPLHQIALLRHPDEPGIAILSVNGDGSLTLADNLEDDTAITWAIRQPLAAEQQMRASLTALAASHRQPAFALMFSCIGRGPLFYGSDDRDLLAFRKPSRKRPCSAPMEPARFFRMPARTVCITMPP